MRKAKDATKTVKRAVAGRAARTSIKTAEARTTRVQRPAKRAKAPLAKAIEASELSVSKAQSTVLASKFRTDGPLPKLAVPPTLPSSYGESHLLLLVRDPHMLFAAWDFSPAALASLKGRMGARAFAVSTLTLRLTRAGGGTEVVHVGKKARSRYLKINGGPSFVAEIGFTTPAGRFEQVARSAPCFVPLGTLARQDAMEADRRAVLSYREARAQAIRERENASSQSPLTQVGASQPKEGGSTSEGPIASGSRASAPRSAAPRVLGGASDLYRR